MMRHFILLFVMGLITLNPACNKTSSDAGVEQSAFVNDIRGLVSSADLLYDKPVSRSEEGMPVGNGRMGSLVWTTPTLLRMQINRVDVFPMNRSTNSFPARHTDYASGCGYVDIHLVDYGEDVFSGESFRQHLGLYDGFMTARGNDVSARVLAWHKRDVMAIEIDDRRDQPNPINVDLRMLRYIRQYFAGQNYELSSNHAVKVRTRAHTATSRLDIRGGRIILTQEFRENDHYNASAVAIGMVGRESMARYLNELTVQLTGEPEDGKFAILVSSASTTNPDRDVARLALEELDAAEKKGFTGLLASNKDWWHNFWSKSFIDLHSEDGMADYVEKNYTYFQYVMASSSRGPYMPRYGGMLWYTTGDMREWGSQYWWYNQSAYYNALLPTNRFELMDPLFSHYGRHLDSYALAARQQWGTKGIWLPETTWFDGLAELPEGIAAEMRELYLMRKPWEELSDRFRKFSEPKLKHNARWNWATVGYWDQGHWIIPEKGAGPFGHVTHIVSATAQIAWLAWLRYEYTQDREWLREHAYPMIKGAVEFYRNFPNVRKESDGHYHIYHTNNGEGIWDGHNTQQDIAAMRGMTPILIRASKILGIDAEMRPAWKEFAENIAPLSTNKMLDAQHADQPKHWIVSLYPARHAEPESPGLIPANYYDLCTIGTKDQDMLSTGNATFDAVYKEGVTENTPVHVLNQNPLAAAHLGRASALKHLMPNQLKCLTPAQDFCDWKGGGKTGVLPNRLTLREGPGSIGCQRIGNASAGLHAGLLQSVPPAPGEDPVIYLFPAWPKEWDASYKLAARGGFLVTASIEKGKTLGVKIESKFGNDCRFSNPWPGKDLMINRKGGEAETRSGKVIAFSTEPGEVVAIAPAGTE